MFIMPVTNWHLDVHKGKDSAMLQLLKGLSILHRMKHNSNKLPSQPIQGLVYSQVQQTVSFTEYI